MRCTCNTSLNTNANPDPSRSITARRRATAEAVRRFTRLKRLIVESIVTNDAFGLRTGLVTALAAADEGEFADLPLDQMMAQFDQWLNEQEDEVIFDGYNNPPTVADAPNIWLGAAILGMFAKGMRRGRAELIKAGYDVQAYPPNAVFQYYYNLPAYKDRLSYILDRAYTDLKNVTDAMNADIKRVLLEGLSQGLSPRDVAALIVASVDNIGIKRATLIARTEMIAAHHAANIAEYRAAGVLGVRLLAEWVTAGDRRVCPICRNFDKKDNGYGPGVYTLAQIEFMIPAHPDCRCVAVPLLYDEVIGVV